jgi:hypothetical protein
MEKKELVKKYDEFECYEHDILLKTYHSVRNKINERH